MRRWSEVNNTALGYYWPSHDTLEGGSSILGDSKSSSYETSMVEYQEPMMSGNFSLIFLHHSWPQVTETMENETPKGGLLYCKLFTRL